MASVIRFIGRLLFVTLLLSSAVLKIKQPGSYTTDVTNGYTTIRGLHDSLSSVLPSTNAINAHVPFATVVRVIGAIEALISLLIVFGDRLGGVLLFGYLLVFGVATYANTILNVIVKQKIADLVPLLPQLTLFVTLIGFSLVFMAGRNHCKAPMKV